MGCEDPANIKYGLHNHAFIVYKEGHRRTSGLDDDRRQMVRQMTDVKTASRNIQAINDQTYNQMYFYKMEGRGPWTSPKCFLHLAKIKKITCHGHYRTMRGLLLMLSWLILLIHAHFVHTLG